MVGWRGGVTSAGTGHPMHSHSKTKLPKLTLGQFNGDNIRWKTFWVLYSSTIHLNPKPSDIERFTYLHSLVTKTAKETINGLVLTLDNHAQAKAILQNRFGDEQLIIDIHMELLLGIETVSSSANLVGLCKMYDKIESNVHSLEALGVSAESYGSLLLSSLLLERLLAEIRLVIGRKLLGEWSLKEIMVVMEEAYQSTYGCTLHERWWPANCRQSPNSFSAPVY